MKDKRNVWGSGTFAWLENYFSWTGKLTDYKALIHERGAGAIRVTTRISSLLGTNIQTQPWKSEDPRCLQQLVLKSMTGLTRNTLQIGISSNLSKWASPAQLVKNLQRRRPPARETHGFDPCREDSQEGNDTYSSFLVWKLMDRETQWATVHGVTNSQTSQY